MTVRPARWRRMLVVVAAATVFLLLAIVEMLATQGGLAR